MIVPANTFDGPVRDYVFPGGFFAGLACLLTTLLVDRVAAYPPTARLLQAAAALFAIAAVLGFILFQWIANKKSEDGTSITLNSTKSLAIFGAIIGILLVTLMTVLAAVISLNWLPPKETATDANKVSRVIGGNHG